MTPGLTRNAELSPATLSSMLKSSPEEAGKALDLISQTNRVYQSRLVAEVIDEIVEIIVGTVFDGKQQDDIAGDEDTLDERAIRLLARIGDKGILALSSAAMGRDCDRVIKALEAISLAQEMRKSSSRAGDYPLSEDGEYQLLEDMRQVAHGKAGIKLKDSSIPAGIASGIITSELALSRTYHKDVIDIGAHLNSMPRGRFRD